MEEPIILGIDPGTKHMGLAVLQGGTLLAADVKCLRNGERPHDVIGQARRVVLEYVAQYSPSIVGIEEPLFAATKRAALVSVIAQELEGRSREVGLRVAVISAREVRRVVVGNPYAKKADVAREIVRMGFGRLRAVLPMEPRHAVLGYNPRDRYWLHMFDALAVAIACRPVGRLHARKLPISAITEVR